MSKIRSEPYFVILVYLLIKIDGTYLNTKQLSINHKNNTNKPVQDTHFSSTTNLVKENVSNDTEPESQIYYGGLAYFTYPSVNIELFEEIDIAKPEYIYDSLSDRSNQRYEFSEFNATIQGVDYYRYSLHYFTLPRLHHFSIYSLPKASSLSELFNPYKLVLFIKSRSTETFLRDSIRKTYGDMSSIPEEYGKAKLYFLVSLGRGASKHIHRLLYEQSVHNDLFIMNIVDSYQNNTLKVLMAEDVFVASGATTPYVLLGDDDTCIHVRRILKLLMDAPTKRYNLGKCLVHKKGNVDPHSKHGVSLEAMPNYITFTQANAMVMTGDLIYEHVRLMRRVPALTHIDDGQIGVFNNMVNTTYVCKRFVKDLRKEKTDSLMTHVYEYSIHYCKSSRLMRSVCNAVNEVDHVIPI